MENETEGIDLAEFMLNQLEFSINRKENIQGKATGYITAVALIVASLLSFIAIIVSTNSGTVLGNKFFIPAIIEFGIGIFEFILCSIMLFPNPLWYFTTSKLMNLYKMRDRFSEQEITNLVLDENLNFVETNERITRRLGIGYIVSSIGIIVLVAGFIAIGVLFFVSIKGVF